MYILIKNNVEKEVDNEIACNQLISDGFKLIEKQEEVIDKKKKTTKK